MREKIRGLFLQLFLQGGRGIDVDYDVSMSCF